MKTWFVKKVNFWSLSEELNAVTIQGYEIYKITYLGYRGTKEEYSIIAYKENE